MAGLQTGRGGGGTTETTEADGPGTGRRPLLILYADRQRLTALDRVGVPQSGPLSGRSGNLTQCVLVGYER